MASLDEYASSLKEKGLPIHDYQKAITKGKIAPAGTNLRLLRSTLKYPTHVLGPLRLPAEEHILLSSCRDLAGTDFIVALEKKPKSIHAYVFRALIERIVTADGYKGKVGHFARA